MKEVTIEPLTYRAGQQKVEIPTIQAEMVWLENFNGGVVMPADCQVGRNSVEKILVNIESRTIYIFTDEGDSPSMIYCGRDFTFVPVKA